MIKRKKSVFCIILAVFVILALGVFAMTLVYFALRPPSASFIIPERRLPERIISALKGDGEAAATLSWHFGTVIRDFDTAMQYYMYWLIIEAENGSLGAKYVLASTILFSSIVEKPQTRGIFWLREAAKHDHRDSLAMLHRRGYTIETAQPPNDSNFPYHFTAL